MTTRPPDAHAAPRPTVPARSALLVVLLSTLLALAGLEGVARAEAPPAPGGCTPDLVVTVLADGYEVCHHGGDRREDLPSPAASRASIRAATTQAGSPDGPDEVLVEAGDPLVCHGDGTSGSRIQALYVRADVGADRYPAVHDELEGYAREVQQTFAASATAHGGAERVPAFVTTRPSGGSCSVDFAEVTLTSDQLADFGDTIGALRAKGFDDPDRLYLLWVDDSFLCGIATLVLDDRAGTTNVNARASRAAYARVDQGCWGYAETHEVAHNLGAVQQSAPNSTLYGHCTDGREVMCYRDGSPETYRSDVCDAAFAALLDCNGDDYFHPAPRSGSYLATHWNTYEHPALRPPPTSGGGGTSDGGPSGGSDGPSGTSTAPTFSDVGPDHPFRSDIAALAASGITTGCGGGRFCPDGKVTRGQMAAFLTRALSLPAGSGRFSDVPSDHLFRRDVSALAASGITRGCGGTRFCPDSHVTRAQMAAFLNRAGLAR